MSRGPQSLSLTLMDGPLCRLGVISLGNSLSTGEAKLGVVWSEGRVGIPPVQLQAGGRLELDQDLDQEATKSPFDQLQQQQQSMVAPGSMDEDDWDPNPKPTTLTSTPHTRLWLCPS